MSLVLSIFAIIGGLALFLYGLFMMSNGLQKVAGDRLREMLEKLTNRPIKGVFVGLFTTAMIQSSSLASITLLGFINSGLISLKQAVGVILGMEIGTTITAQIISFKIGITFFPLISVGFFLFFFGQKEKYKNIGHIILGLGVLFLGMHTMSSALRPLGENIFFINLLRNFGKIPILGILTGAALTGIVQSSSATTGLVIAMSAENIIDLNSAIPIILGANIGTCVTALIASVGSSLSAKRAAVSHLLFNAIGVILFFPFLAQFAWIVSLTSGELARQIANAHTIFNATMTIVMLPIIGGLVILAKKIVPGEDVRLDKRAMYLDDKIVQTPSIAIGQAKRETIRMAAIVTDMLHASETALLTKEQRFITLVLKSEELVDELDDLIERYLTKISRQPLSQNQSKDIATLVHSISDIERVADHAHNIAELTEYMAKEKLFFSKNAMDELQEIFDAAKCSYINAVEVLHTRDEKLGKEVLDLEVKVDHMQRELEKSHFDRLKKGVCQLEAGPIYLDITRNLERISDHAHNIAYATIIGF
ncbi:Na/Pi cotransporter family protein [Candidatus Aerophobetes bacterium]|nr:Na/Pi cotransporter family protein [Candidatus Aerophobetes bacterium]